MAKQIVRAPINAPKLAKLAQRPDILLGLGVLALAGCIGDPTADAKVPGDALGNFQVTAVLVESSCGPGALGSQNTWSFPLRLSRSGAALYWLNGAEAIVGEVQESGNTLTFQFDSRLVQQISAPHGAHPGCALVRTDRSTGTLLGSRDALSSFTGDLEYAFAADAGSDCSDLPLEPGGLMLLPCQMRYRMTGVRVAQSGP